MEGSRIITQNFQLEMITHTDQRDSVHVRCLSHQCPHRCSIMVKKIPGNMTMFANNLDPIFGRMCIAVGEADGLGAPDYLS